MTHYVQPNISHCITDQSNKKELENTCWLFQLFPCRRNPHFRLMLHTQVYGMLNNAQQERLHVDGLAEKRKKKGTSNAIPNAVR
jgi:hypothetical protein